MKNLHARERRRRIGIALLFFLAVGVLLGAVPMVRAIAAGMARRAKHASSAPESGAAGANSTPALPGQSTAGASGTRAPGAASIGVLAHGSALGTHNCTAAVVASRAGNVIITAAHCFAGTGVGLVFAPGYRNGTAPYGTWDVQAAYVDPGWLSGQHPDDDVAFLVVTPSASNPNRKPVQAVVGGYALGTAPDAGSTVQVTGYVSGAADPVVCSASAYDTSGYPSFDCAGFAGGTSGGPWVTTGADGAARISAVIGGLHAGGCVVSTSYSSPFTTETTAVFARADSGGPADTLPVPPADGC